MTKEIREFQIFAKPVGAACNLRCSYCYYLNKGKLNHANDSCLMPDDILENYIIQHIEASAGSTVSFSWHGGEPLLAGLDFFRKVVSLQRKYQPERSTIVNGIQTNGTLIDEKWCRFLSAENFVVGISIDGPGPMHNKFRVYRDKAPTLKQVLKGYELLQNHRIPCEILCVVSANNVKYPLVVYNFFKELGVKYISFLPLAEQNRTSLLEATGRSVPSLAFGVFLSTIFDEWVEKDIGKIKIQLFEEALRAAFDQEHTLCIFKEKCGGVPVIGHNGDFYSCDHYVDSAHHLGNILENSLGSLLDSERQQSFGQAKSTLLPLYCLECEVRSMCNGECPKNRFSKTPGGESGLNYLCKGYKHFFTHCRPFVDAIREVWKNQGR